MAAAVAVARTTVPDTDSALVALVCIALIAAELRSGRLGDGADFGVVVVDALRALLEEAEAVGRFLSRSVEGGVTGTGRTASAQGKRPVGKLRRRAGDNKALLVADGLLHLTESCIAGAGRQRVTELKAKTLLREPVLRTDGAEFPRPVAEETVVVAAAALDIFEALAVEAGLRRGGAVVAAAGRAKPTVVAGTGSLRARGLAGTMARAHLPCRVGRAAHIASGAEKDGIARGVLTALAEAIVVADPVCRALRPAQRRGDAVECLRHAGAYRLTLGSASKGIALAYRSVALQTAYTAQITGFAETVCTRIARNVALL